MDHTESTRTEEKPDYSLASFEEAQRDPKRLAALSRTLRDDITDRLQPALIRLLEEIVAELNAQGHNLKLYIEPSGGAIAYRDTGGAEHPVPKLRVAHDSVVSTGFGDFDPT